MRTIRLILLAFAVAVVGCDDRDTIVFGNGLILIGNFPGDQVIDHFVGDDGRAFTHSAAKVNKGIQVFWNCANGHAIIMYLDSFERLWVHHWNGTSFTPGVELRIPAQQDLAAEDEDDTDQDWCTVDNFRVLFLNTVSHPDANARARDGDAIIIWVREDEEPSDGDVGGNGLDPDADNNHRLCGTYFDVSARGTAATGSIHYGFETDATVMDFDNKLTGETADPDVDSFGFVSDSLKWSHGYDERDSNSIEFPLSRHVVSGVSDLALPPATRSGDPTTLVFIVWAKEQRSGSGVLAGLPDNDIRRRWHYLEFDLTQAGNGIPVQTALGQNTIPFPAGAVVNNFTGVDEAAVAHNDCLVWRSATASATGVFLSCFAAGAAPTTIELSASVQDTPLAGPSIWSDTNPQLPRPEDVYAGDHGLTSLYAFFETSGGFAGDHLAATKVDLDGAGLTREIEPIECPSQQPIVSFDGTRIGRDSDWIAVFWQQATGSTDAIVAGNGFDTIFGRGVQTRTGAAARTLVNSVTGPIAPPNQSDNTQDPMRITIQSEIASGTYAPRCGIQSNRHRINFAWHQVAGNLQTLYHNGIVFTPSVDPGAAPTAAPGITDPAGGCIGQTDNRYIPYQPENGMHPLVADLGTTDGSPLIYFIANANNPTDFTAQSAFDELRIHGVPGTPTATFADARVISTDGPGQDNVAMSEAMLAEEGNFFSANDSKVEDFAQPAGHLLRIRTTPTSQAPGNHGGTQMHLFMREARGAATNSIVNLVTRRFVKSLFNPASKTASFGSAHAPALGADPTPLVGQSNPDIFLRGFQRDTQGKNELAGRRGVADIGPTPYFTTASGDQVGIYFTAGIPGAQHFLYQEFDGTAWMTSAGVPDPQIIDNLSPSQLFQGVDQNAYVFPPMRNGTCDDFNGALAFYSKSINGEDIGTRRWVVRVRD